MALFASSKAPDRDTRPRLVVTRDETSQPSGRPHDSASSAGVRTGREVSFSSDKSTITPPGSVTLTWSSPDAKSCYGSASSARSEWVGNKPAAGSQTITAITTQTAFLIVCRNTTGEVTVKSLTVGVTPPAEGAMVRSQETFTVEQVDIPVTQTACPEPRYPPAMKTAGVQGNVALRYVVGADGRIERRSVVVISATNKAFEEPAIQTLMSCTYTPAKVGGSPVRQLMEQNIRFTIGG